MFRIKFSTLLLVSLTVLTTSSCGFKPLYEKKESQKGNVRSCGNFDVDIEGRDKFGLAGQSMKYKLQDALNQVCINEDRKYRVNVSLSKSKDAVGIQKDTQVTRYNISITADFVVNEAGRLKKIYSGASTLIGGFDASISDYGTYAQEQDTQSRLLEELANDISLKISSTLLRKNKTENEDPAE